MSAAPWGATADEWAFWSRLAGPDLLPVVSNVHAKISPSSTMGALGKTPSRYNSRGEVVGIPNWTSYQATPEDIAAWSRQGDYGICLQTRRYRAYDIDVDDLAAAVAIEGFILRSQGISGPCRTRSNSGKRLILFRLDGELTKQILRTEGGMVELLATGQQCIVAGTHTSGVRYQWNRLEDDFV